MMVEVIDARVLECVRSAPKPPITIKQIAVTVRCSSPYAYRAARRLENDGRLVSVKATRGARTRAYAAVEGARGE